MLFVLTYVAKEAGTDERQLREITAEALREKLLRGPAAAPAAWKRSASPDIEHLEFGLWPSRRGGSRFDGP
ncbi:hypothetical protein ACF1BB_27220 [Streptomyces griseoluteus]|uniref:hypothetical protein n=1 Tax=Streptomyces griseoluteus TaxID=29306 RepID=UPI0036F8B440